MPQEDMTRKPWYERSFGEFYPLVYRHRDDAAAGREVSALAALLEVPRTASVLDLCCGAGRHAAALARLGFDVVACDLSEPLLALARERPPLQGRLVRADMRRLPFASGGGRDRGFDLVLNLFTSFGYFESDSENEAALAEMARVLKRGGLLVLDHINRDRLERTLEPESEEVQDGVRIRCARRIEGNRAIKEVEIRSSEHGVQAFRESVRLYAPGELRALCGRFDLAVVRLMGSHEGEPLGPGSPRMIVAAAKGGREPAP